MKKIGFILILFFIFSILQLKASGTGDATENTIVDREQQELQWCFTYSNILGYNISYISNPRLYQGISEWLGTPYKYSGKSKKGVDCSGLVCQLYSNCYNKQLTGGAKEIYKNTEQVRRSDLREGDLVFFKIKRNRVSHVGIYLGENKFVHSSLQHGVIVSDLDDPYYSKYFFRGGRINL